MSEPILPLYCASCGETYLDGCDRDHEHGVFVCYGIDDTRNLWCGCVAHKECQKDGDHCREHGDKP